MQYGSIGWAVGALLGYQMAWRGQKRVLAFIGDGSFQVTAQDVSTMLRYRVAPILFLINNKVGAPCLRCCCRHWRRGKDLCGSW